MTESFTVKKNEQIPEDVHRITDEKIIAYIDEILREPKFFVGKGNIAEVYKLDSNTSICFKLIDEGKNGTIALALRGENPYFNSISVEANFLTDLQNVDSKVRVPRPLYTVEREVERSGQETAIVSVLAMELLPAVSIRDVLDEMAELPDKFDRSSFFLSLHKFFEKMHEKGIYHRDVHAGNIMIGTKGGEPYVIDFGTAVYSNAEDAYQGSRRGATTRFRNDFNGLEIVEREVSQFLTKLNK
ncbi:MAG: protein kinase family protein [Candidatus Taylorbacteria bacterium]|nr:protein kinase family protein [Candidatus Taylorbacteria bacterium]